jgi:hypothetical protein
MTAGPETPSCPPPKSAQAKAATAADRTPVTGSTPDAMARMMPRGRVTDATVKPERRSDIKLLKVYFPRRSKILGRKAGAVLPQFSVVFISTPDRLKRFRPFCPFLQLPLHYTILF